MYHKRLRLRYSPIIFIMNIYWIMVGRGTFYNELHKKKKKSYEDRVHLLSPPSRQLTLLLLLLPFKSDASKIEVIRITRRLLCEFIICIWRREAQMPIGLIYILFWWQRWSSWCWWRWMLIGKCSMVAFCSSPIACSFHIPSQSAVSPCRVTF